MSGYVETVAMHEETWATFLEPDSRLQDIDDLHTTLGIEIKSGSRPNFKPFSRRNTIFDKIAARISAASPVCEDQCSSQHYFDIFNCVYQDHGEVSRIVDLGVWMGGTSSVFAGCVQALNLDLDLVDADRACLQFTYERLRRLFPEAMPRVRMYHGDLPTYIDRVLRVEPATPAMIHHDGPHDFNQVVKDLSSLYFVRDRVHSLAIQDTHLRGSPDRFIFVDAAVFAVFGCGVRHEPIGARYESGALTQPNRWEGNYFLPGTSEGMYIRVAEQEFLYPHPAMKLESFLPVKAPAPPTIAREGAT